MPGPPDYTIYAFTDMSMCTSASNGDTSFLLPYNSGARLTPKAGEDAQQEREVEPSYGFDDFLSSMDILVCGRRTYDQIMHQAKGQWPYPRKRLIVFSRSPLNEPLPALDNGAWLGA